MIRIEAFDADEPDTDNSDLRYSILSQDPEFPSRSMFAINPVTGTITVNDGRLLKEVRPVLICFIWSEITSFKQSVFSSSLLRIL